MRREGVVLVVALGAVAVFACGAPKLPAPPYVSQPTSALAEVPYPPPPARIEAVPRRPKSNAVWIDGEWIWQTRRWAWKPGRWIVPPTGARFAAWTTVRGRTGALYFASGRWRDASGAEVAEPEPLAIAGPAPAAVVTPEGESVVPGPNAPVDAGTPPTPVPGSDAGDAPELDAPSDVADGGATVDAQSGP